MQTQTIGYETAHAMIRGARMGVEVVAKGTRKSDGATLYGVTSASELGRLHLVVWNEAAQKWECDCAGFAWRSRCRHVRAVADRQIAEQAMRRDSSMLRQPPAFSILKH